MNHVNCYLSFHCLKIEDGRWGFIKVNRCHLIGRLERLHFNVLMFANISRGQAKRK